MINILLGCLNYFIAGFIVTGTDNLSKFLKILNYIAGTVSIIVGFLNIIGKL